MHPQMAAARETSGKEADLSSELSRVRAELAAALAEKGELEEALGLMEQNNSAQVAALQVRRLDEHMSFVPIADTQVLLPLKRKRMSSVLACKQT
jgi:hypothetical protein